MLVAEIHGHFVPEALGSEDYLTSAVFGHLRYLPASLFWADLFASALNLPAENLTAVLTNKGIDFRLFDSVTMYFWPSHPKYGIPDCLICFSGSRQKAIAILIEAKLTATKSGTGEQDQLARYMKLLDEDDGFGGRLPAGCESFVVYLTDHDSTAEIEESIGACSHPDDARHRMFHLSWQDIIIASEKAHASGLQGLILSDVAAFLRSRGLEYFKGFSNSQIPELRPELGRFYGGFAFGQLPLPQDFTVRRGEWVHGQ
ncbi:MAG: hypothetical protein WB952_22680 [Terriglobales bacterium]